MSDSQVIELSARELSQLDDLAFERVWEETKIYDYAELDNILKKYPGLRPKIFRTTKRIDIHDDSFSEDNLIRIEEKFNSRVKVNLVDIEFENFNEIVSLVKEFPMIKNLININVDGIDNSLFKIFSFILKRVENDRTLIIDLHDTKYLISNIRRITYDNEIFILDIKSRTNISLSIDKFLVSLQPKVVGNYGDKDILAMIELDSVEGLHFIARTDSIMNHQVDQRVNILEALAINENYYNTDIGAELEVIINDEGDKIHLNNNCKITTITFEEEYSYDREYSILAEYDAEDFDEEFMEVYPSVIQFDVPITLNQFHFLVDCLPNVPQFNIIYYEDRDNEILEAYQELYPNKIDIWHNVRSNKPYVVSDEEEEQDIDEHRDQYLDRDLDDRYDEYEESDFEIQSNESDQDNYSDSDSYPDRKKSFFEED